MGFNDTLSDTRGSKEYSIFLLSFLLQAFASTLRFKVNVVHKVVDICSFVNYLILEASQNRSLNIFVILSIDGSLPFVL